MRRGDFEYSGDDGDQPVFRIRWLDEDSVDTCTGLTPEEMQRGLFIRYLIQSGRVSEGLTSAPRRRRTRVSS